MKAKMKLLEYFFVISTMIIPVMSYSNLATSTCVCRKFRGSYSLRITSSTGDTSEGDKKLRNSVDRDIMKVALPAFFSLAADPLASFVDAMYVGRLGAIEQAGMGVAISAQYSIAKLYNDPLLKTSTSLVAGKSGDELAASVTTAISTAIIIGAIQTVIFICFSGQVMSAMGVNQASEMRRPALAYLKWRALGIPAATVLLVSNGIFRGRGDTVTPFYCTLLGNVVNIVLDPILIFTFGMGCAGAGAATAVSQWVTAIPLLYTLNKRIPFTIDSTDNYSQIRTAILQYFTAGGLIFFRTIAKISAYTVTASAAARLGTIAMAAYSLTFNLGFVTSQLCEAFSIAAQSLIAREMPIDTPTKRLTVAHTINRALLLGLLVSGLLSITTLLNMEGVLTHMTSSAPVQAAAAAVMPVVLLTQLFKGLSYSTGGILLGGLDWMWSTVSMSVASVVCVGLISLMPSSLWNIWVALAAFMATQVVLSSSRIFSGRGPWKGLQLLRS